MSHRIEKSRHNLIWYDLVAVIEVTKSWGGGGSGGKAGRPLISGLAVPSPAPSIHVLKCPWARRWRPGQRLAWQLRGHRFVSVCEHVNEGPIVLYSEWTASTSIHVFYWTNKSNIDWTHQQRFTDRSWSSSDSLPFQIHQFVCFSKEIMPVGIHHFEPLNLIMTRT